jgi:hypothetical protein
MMHFGDLERVVALASLDVADSRPSSNKKPGGNTKA